MIPRYCYSALLISAVFFLTACPARTRIYQYYDETKKGWLILRPDGRASMAMPGDLAVATLHGTWATLTEESSVACTWSQFGLESEPSSMDKKINPTSHFCSLSRSTMTFRPFRTREELESFSASKSQN